MCLFRLIFHVISKYLVSKKKRSIQIGGFKAGSTSEKKRVKNDCICLGVQYIARKVV